MRHAKDRLGLRVGVGISVLRIYLADLYHDYLPTRQHVPLGIAYIGSYLKKEFGAEVETRLFKSAEKLLDAIDGQRPDMVALANYTWNESLNDFAGRHIRKTLGDDVPIVMGGPNIRIDEAGVAAFLNTHTYVDRYVLYAGERPMADIVRRLKDRPVDQRKSGDVRKLQLFNSHALVDGKLSGGAEVGKENSLDFVPSPYLSGMLDDFLDDGFLPIIETNRGCPFSCTFCVWGISALSEIKQFSMERVRAELEYLAGSRWSFSELVFADANFGILKRDVEIAQHLRNLYQKFASFQAVQVYWSKSAQPHMVDIGKILGQLTHTYVAFQSLDPVVLEAIKRKNISTDKLVHLINELRSYTHSTQTDLLVGLPNEDFESHLRSIDSALRYGINMIFGGEIRLLPGSEMDTEASRAEFKLRTKYRLCEGQYGRYRGELVYELEEVVRQTSTMTEDEMLRLRVLRTIFFASVTLGEHRPIISYLVKKGLSAVEFFKRLAEPDARYPAFDRALAWCRDWAVNEWFTSVDEVAKRLAKPENAEAMFHDGAFFKLNYGMLARLICHPDEYADFCRKVEDTLRGIVPDEDPEVVREIVALCSARNFIRRTAVGDDLTAPKAVLSAKTRRILHECGYLSSDESGPDSALPLQMTELTAEIIRKRIAEFRKDPTVLHMSQLLEQLRGRTYLEVLSAGHPPSRVNDQQHEHAAA